MAEDSQNSSEDLNHRMQEARQAVSKDPRNVELLLQLGEAAEAAGDPDRARWAYKRAIRLEPDLGQAYYRLGLLYQSEGRNKAAVSVLQSALRYPGHDFDLEPVREGLRELLGQDEIEPSQLCDESPACKQLNQAWQELDLTPAEALMLLDPEGSSGRQMMGVTLLDMVIRGVLEMEQGDQLGRGQAYLEARLRPHEELFAKYFTHFDDTVDADRLAQAALNEINNRTDIFKAGYVRASLIEKGYLQPETRRLFGLFPVPGYALSDKGIYARDRLKRLLKESDRQIARSVKTEPGQAKAYVTKGGPPILLLDRYPAATFQEWQEMLNRLGFGPAVERLRRRGRR